MIESKLAYQIAQAESLQSFCGFGLPEQIIVDYPFLKESDDFYIELIGKMHELLKPPYNNASKDELLAVAKGLQVYSLRECRKRFNGVQYAGNMLYAGGLFFLADFPSSAYLMARLFNVNDYIEDIDKFIWSFLSRDTKDDNIFNQKLRIYLKNGDHNYFDELLNNLRSEVRSALKYSPLRYTSALLALALSICFEKKNLWATLSPYGTIEHWSDYVYYCISKTPPVWDFFPSQIKALSVGLLNSTSTVSLQMPTSSGKSAVCELLAYDEIKKSIDTKVLFLTPFRAMASELKDGLAKRLWRLGISAKTIYGGNIPTPAERQAIEDSSLLIATPEKLMAISNAIPSIMSAFKIVICDEGHLLDDSSRGLRYELLLTRLNYEGRNIGRRFVFISAIVPNIHEINKWLNGTTDSVAISQYRPTNLEYAFLREGRRKGNYYLDYNPTSSKPQNYQIYRFLTETDFRYTNLKTNRQNKYPYNKKATLTLAVALKALPAGAVAIFTTHKKGQSGVQALVKELITMHKKKLPLPRPLDYADKILTHNLVEYTENIFGPDHLLPNLCKMGVVYHTGDLPQYVREAIERAIRDGGIRLVICTNTLAEGVNLPIKSIVLHTIMRYENEKWRPISFRNLRNLVGRAGRAGQETSGLVLVPHDDNFHLVTQLINGAENEVVRGYFFRVISAIAAFVKEKGLKIEAETFSNAGLTFQNLLDSIDMSIIDLLAEDIDTVELSKTVDIVLKETFAYTQANDHERETLGMIVSHRLHKMNEIVEKGEFPKLKRSGVNFREFDSICEATDFTEDVWQSLTDAIDEDWLDLITKITLAMPTINQELLTIVERSKVVIDSNMLISLLKLWISGAWFPEIAEMLNTSVDNAVNIVNGFVLFSFLTKASGIIRCAEDVLSDKTLTPSSTLLSWPINLTMGVPTNVEVSLVELGFNDRFGVLALGEIIRENSILSDVNSVRTFIQTNEEEIKDIIKGKIPTISLNATLQAYDYITFF